MFRLTLPLINDVTLLGEGGFQEKWRSEQIWVHFDPALSFGIIKLKLLKLSITLSDKKENCMGKRSDVRLKCTLPFTFVGSCDQSSFLWFQ